MNVTGHTATCARCAAANPPDARFCMDCGAAITQACTACGAEAPERAHYCIKCGAALGGASAGPPVPNEERRTVTVLFADLVGYTSVSERLDHETVKTLTDRCLTRLAREVERYGGFVDQYIGDNVMAVFGAPVAHEDDAERAVRAGWGMQAAMGDLNQVIVPEYGFELALRVGVNTGEVLAGRVGGQYTVVGDAVNVAARLQGAAPVGGVLVGARTRRMSSRAAAFRPIGALALKGKADAVEAWEVTSVSDRPGAPGAEAPRTPLVGRRTELSQLRALFERVDRDGAPHAVTVLGEAGVGKTRLLREFERELERAAPHARVISGRCHAFGSGTYWPLAEMLREQCEIVSGDTPADVRAKLAARFAEHIALSEGEDHVEHRIV
ncbi:MAG TPA: adenylate/guanylate cyclase domain-containing protein, partial [Solirubrobacteraceae bacterium]